MTVPASTQTARLTFSKAIRGPKARPRPRLETPPNEEDEPSQSPLVSVPLAPPKLYPQEEPMAWIHGQPSVQKQLVEEWVASAVLSMVYHDRDATLSLVPAGGTPRVRRVWGEAVLASEYAWDMSSCRTVRVSKCCLMCSLRVVLVQVLCRRVYVSAAVADDLGGPWMNPRDWQEPLEQELLQAAVVQQPLEQELLLAVAQMPLEQELLAAVAQAPVRVSPFEEDGQRCLQSARPENVWPAF